jgi:hypothetical protein
LGLLDRFREEKQSDRIVRDRFISVPEYYIFLRNFVARLEHKGHLSAASEIRSSLSHLNGRTLEWALFLEVIEKTESLRGPELGPSEASDLHDVVHYARLISKRT